MEGEKKVIEFGESKKVSFSAKKDSVTLFISRVNPAVVNKNLKLGEQYKISFEIDEDLLTSSLLKIGENDTVEVVEV
jgi:hypothetical protein